VPRAVFDFVDGAACDEVTARRNRADFERWALVPRALSGVEQPRLGATVLGHATSFPLLGTPTGLTGLVHHLGERDARNGFGIPPRATPRTIAGALRRPRWTAAFLSKPGVTVANAVAPGTGRADPVSLSGYITAQFDPSATWKELDWFRGTPRWRWRPLLWGAQIWQTSTEAGSPPPERDRLLPQLNRYIANVCSTTEGVRCERS
jgi:isopentenyl diphosphate isomerase/L-lactate dehydrogenase-like FMN-dependent dehydrogenase